MSKSPANPLWHPKHWPTWLAVGLWRFVALLPYNPLMALGRAIGRLLMHKAKRRRDIAEKNIELCFPELSSDEQQKRLKAYFESAGMGLMDIAVSWWWSDKAFFPRVRIHGAEHLDAAYAKEKGVILYTGHFACLDISGRILASRWPSLAMYRPNENPVLQHTIDSGRMNFMEGTIPRDNMRLMVKTLKSKKGVWFAPDQNYGHKNSVFADFFGIAAATNTSATRIAKLSGSVVIPFATYRSDDGHYDLYLEPALDGFPGASEAQDAQRLNDILEALVRKAPEQYNWMHRRFKDRPAGEKRFY